jgi:peptide deformylase
MYDEFDGESRLTRISVQLSRRMAATSLVAKVTLSLVGVGVVCWLGSLVGHAFFESAHSATSEAIKRSDLYGTLPEHVDAYQWLGDVKAERVAQHVIDARAKLQRTNQLVLVADFIPDSAAALVTREFLFTERERLARTLHETSSFLEANPSELCVCAPQFGIDLRHIALRYTAAPDAAEEPAGGDTSVRLSEGGLPIFHMFNPENTDSKAYDDLSAEAFDAAGVKVSLSEESAAARYNDERRGFEGDNFTVIRPDKVVVEMIDFMHHTQFLTVRGEMAHCVQRCLDLLDGLSIFDRALRQFEHNGVHLNWAGDDTYPLGTIRNAAVKDEL